MLGAAEWLFGRKNQKKRDVVLPRRRGGGGAPGGEGDAAERADGGEAASCVVRWPSPRLPDDHMGVAAVPLRGRRRGALAPLSSLLAPPPVDGGERSPAMGGVAGREGGGGGAGKAVRVEVGLGRDEGTLCRLDGASPRMLPPRAHVLSGTSSLSTSPSRSAKTRKRRACRRRICPCITSRSRTTSPSLFVRRYARVSSSFARCNSNDS